MKRTTSKRLKLKNAKNLKFIAAVFFNNCSNENHVNIFINDKGDKLTSSTERKLISYKVNGDNNLVLEDLGIKMRVDTELVKQGLLGVYSESPDNSYQSKSITFTTQELVEKNPSCNGQPDGIDSITRYEGQAKEGLAHHQHPHLSTVFQFSAFHIVFQSVTKSCVAKNTNYAAEEIAKEKAAADGLWKSLQTTKELMASMQKILRV